MLRAIGWLVVAALAVCARWFDSAACRIACAFAVLILIGVSASRSLRTAVAMIALIAIATLVYAGADGLLDTVPALITAFIAWLFARTLLAPRRPLIARAIAAIDGEDQLADPAIAQYARRLTGLWAIYQALLALVALVLAAHAAGIVPWLPMWLPGPRVFGGLVLPAAVLLLLLAEFVLRRLLLPQAPRHHLITFLHRLVLAWPRLIGD